MNIASIIGWVTIILCTLATLLTAFLSSTIVSYVKNGYTQNLNPFSSKGKKFLFGLFLGYGYLVTIAMFVIMLTNKALIMNPMFMLICMASMTTYGAIYNAPGFFGQNFPALGNNQPSIKQFVGLILNVYCETVEAMQNNNLPQHLKKKIMADVFRQINDMLNDDTIEEELSMYDLIETPKEEIIKKVFPNLKQLSSDNKVYFVAVLDMRNKELHFFILDEETDKVTENDFGDILVNSMSIEEYLEEKGIDTSNSEWMVFDKEVNIKIHRQNEVITRIF